ncbi:hypothetical protein M770_04125 [Pseudomonas aeruginosa VRFPA03]|nr:hypothetical protein M770_04125 [Pseudomonas aeruginosa VRFPA03]
MKGIIEQQLIYFRKQCNAIGNPAITVGQFFELAYPRAMCLHRTVVGAEGGEFS